METASHATGAWTARSATLTVHQEEVHTKRPLYFPSFMLHVLCKRTLLFSLMEGKVGGWGVGGLGKENMRHDNRKSRLWKLGETHRDALSHSHRHIHTYKGIVKKHPKKLIKKAKTLLHSTLQTKQTKNLHKKPNQIPIPAKNKLFSSDRGERMKD